MYINFHIRIQKLIERDFPHFPHLLSDAKLAILCAAFPKLTTPIRIVPEHGEH